ncbi:MAG: MmcQ/YjbR family DNA-binding protein [Acidobacteria bacterium]|nr:MmcQ/YjbR family DNA-binding protein [Acidobacteriota bacterium]
MDAAELRRICLSFPASYEDFPFGPETSVFKVRATSDFTGGPGKVFALSVLDEPNLSVSLKCDPALAVQLRLQHPEIEGAYHLNKKHWNGVALTGSLASSMVRDMVEDSYDLVVSKMPLRQREVLGWQRLAAGEA